MTAIIPSLPVETRVASFEDPGAMALSRVGVVDVGSNSVRMVVFDGAARSPAYYYNEKLMCGLGAGVRETGKLNPTGRKRALNAIIRFQGVAKSLGIEPLSAVATAAVREAEDGPDFKRDVLEATGLDLQIINGPEEARLSAQGVLLGWPGSYGLVCDIGGASMELATIGDGNVGKCVTSELGPLRLKGIKGGKKGRAAFIKETVQDLSDQIGTKSERLFLVGGSWRAIAKIDMIRRGYPLHVLHEYRMTVKHARETIKFIRKTDVAELQALSGNSPARMALVPIAAEVLSRLLKTFKPDNIAVSSYGIREGLLYEKMPDHVREMDPLIESCRFSEAKDARIPGFGDVLYDFVMPLFKSTPKRWHRIIHAACLLHDVSWRAHPDYRADTCFDNATRANLGGLRHSERIFLGLALLHRYKNKREGNRFESLAKLLPENDLHRAEVLGKAMRFGAMMWLQSDARPGKFKWHPRKRLLVLYLSDRAQPLFGETAKARLQSLADSLGADIKVKRLKDD